MVRMKLICALPFSKKLAYIDIQSFTSLNSNELFMMVSVCWKLWEARNEKVWNHSVLSTHAIIRGAQVFLHEWQHANTPTAATSVQEIKPPAS